MRLLSLPAVLLSLVAAAAQPDVTARHATPGAVGTESLGRLLKDLGLGPKALSPDVFQIAVERDQWPVYIMTSLSTDGRRVWLESKFAPVDDPDKVPQAAWKRLLEANEKIGPAHFAFDKSDRRVHLYKSFDNVDVTAERLKIEIEQFDTTVRKTQDYWRGDNFKPVATAAAPGPELTARPPPPEPPAVPAAGESREYDRLLGDWKVTSIHINGKPVDGAALQARKPGVTIRREAGSRIVAELRIAPDRARTVAVSVGSAGPAKRIDLTDDRDRVEHGIYQCEGDTLTLCFAAPGEPRPTGFNPADESRNWLIVLARTK